MAYRNPLRRCVECIYKVGFGYTTIGNLTGINKSLCRKWVRKMGIERGFKKSSRPLNPKRGDGYAKRVKMFETALNKCIRRSKRFFLSDETRRQSQNARFRRDPKLRILRALRHRTWTVIKRDGGVKAASWTSRMLGCNREALMAHLESQFLKGMNWDNYGKAWEVDHVLPCSSFDMAKPEDQLRCFHYSNLRPLAKSDNRRKWATVVACQPELLLSI